MGYEYAGLDYIAIGQRSNAKIGMVYIMTNDTQHNRLQKGDLLLCLFKSGDCHYDYVRITLETDNEHHCYYNLNENHSGYGSHDKKEAFPKMRCFSASDLVHILHSRQCLITSNRTKSDDELEKIKELDKLEQQIFNLKHGELK